MVKLQRKIICTAQAMTTTQKPAQCGHGRSLQAAGSHGPAGPTQYWDHQFCIMPSELMALEQPPVAARQQALAS